MNLNIALLVFIFIGGLLAGKDHRVKGWIGALIVSVPLGIMPIQDVKYMLNVLFADSTHIASNHEIPKFLPDINNNERGLLVKASVKKEGEVLPLSCHKALLNHPLTDLEKGCYAHQKGNESLLFCEWYPFDGIPILNSGDITDNENCFISEKDEFQFSRGCYRPFDEVQIKHAKSTNLNQITTETKPVQIKQAKPVPTITQATNLSDLEKLAVKTANENGIPSDLFRALVTQESGWNPNAESPKGARGLGQVMPFNAELCGIKEDDLWIPEKNLQCSALILKDALNYWNGKFKDNHDKAIRHALAEYNAGRKAVEERNALTDFGETRRYVDRIIAILNSYANIPCNAKHCLRMKENANNGGEALPGLFALASLLQSNVEGLIYFSAFNDGYKHIENGHKEGRALDFTLVDNSKSGAVVKQIKAIGKQAGVNLRILDEVKKPSSRSTGPHIHVEFNTPEDATTFLIYVTNTGVYRDV